MSANDLAAACQQVTDALLSLNNMVFNASINLTAFDLQQGTNYLLAVSQELTNQLKQLEATNASEITGGNQLEVSTASALAGLNQLKASTASICSCRFESDEGIHRLCSHRFESVKGIHRLTSHRFESVEGIHRLCSHWFESVEGIQRLCSHRFESKPSVLTTNDYRRTPASVRTRAKIRLTNYFKM